MIEYTLLIGLLAAVALFVVVPIYQKIEQRFTTLQTALNYKPTSGPVDHNTLAAQIKPSVTTGVKNDSSLLVAGPPGGGTPGGGTPPSGGTTIGGGTTSGGTTNSGGTSTASAGSSGGPCDSASFRNHGQYQACLNHAQHHN